MSRIGTNVQSLIAQRVLSANNEAVTTSLERLSTGLAINRGKDDPAGLIVSETLREEKARIASAIGNAERADQVVNIAEAGLTEINNMLVELQTLVSETANEAGMSAEEREANQLQVDAILQTVDRIAATTSFNGAKLLSGAFDYSVSNAETDLVDFTVNNAKIADGGSVSVDVVVNSEAQHGSLYLSTGGNLSFTGGGDPTGKFEFEVTGSKGSRAFSFASGATTSAVQDAINAFKDATGVSAKASGTGIYLKSEEFGSEEFVSVRVLNPGNSGNELTGSGVIGMAVGDEDTLSAATAVAYTAATTKITDAGDDVDALINGVKARGKGLEISVSTDALDASITLNSGNGGGGHLDSTISAFTITGGGANFNLGPNVDLGNKVSLGLPNVAVRNLGSKLTGYLDEVGSGGASNLIDGNLADAQDIVNTAIKDVSSLRGRLGAFQKNVVGSTIRSLNITFENISAAESAIRDTDFAQETANLTRNQVLVQAASSALAIANSTPQNVLQLI